MNTCILFQTTMLLLGHVALLATLLCSGALAFHRKPRGFRPDIIPEITWSPTERLVEYAGYECETHTVHTPDGYLLNIHRVPRSKNETVSGASPPHRTPILMGHGLAANSEMWTFPGPSLAFFLVDSGFDVWLTNYRGSFYGRRHETLSPESHEFWDFSWHENGLIDQTALIDYVVRVTGRPKVFTLGHSMGTTTQAVMMSEKPEYAKEKVYCSIMIAPPIYFVNNCDLRVLVNTIGMFIPQLRGIFSRVVNDKMPVVDTSFVPLCYDGRRLRNVCKMYMINAMGKPRIPYDDPAVLQTLMAHYPNGASIRQYMHFFQSGMHGDFRKFDFGVQKNMQLYGSPEPPKYNLSAIQTPIYVFYGSADNQVVPRDAELFVSRCPAVKKSVKLQDYNHFDYIAGDTADIMESVNKPILEILQSYL